MYQGGWSDLLLIILFHNLNNIGLANITIIITTCEEPKYLKSSGIPKITPSPSLFTSQKRHSFGCMEQLMRQIHTFPFSLIFSHLCTPTPKLCFFRLPHSTFHSDKPQLIFGLIWGQLKDLQHLSLKSMIFSNFSKLHKCLLLSAEKKSNIGSKKNKVVLSILSTGSMLADSAKEQSQLSTMPYPQNKFQQEW